MRGVPIPMGFLFFEIGIEIAIGIEIDLPDRVTPGLLADVVTSTAEPTEHGRHAVQLGLALPTLGLGQCVADNENVLDCCALQCRATGDLEIPSPGAHVLLETVA